MKVKNGRDECQIFTPRDTVNYLLDQVGYVANLKGKKILENACGDGCILNVVVDRYIKDSIKNNVSLQNIKLGLEEDIFGIEIEAHHYATCLKNLNQTATKYEIHNVQWNLFCEDALRKTFDIKFDYVVGNPPYIRYKYLNKTDRLYIKEKFTVCQKGKFDYCYAFIEMSLISLNDSGKLAYLIPNSIFKNVFAQNLREFIKNSLVEVHDYTTKKIFDVITSSAIIVCDKAKNRKMIKYIDVANENKSYSIHKTKLTGKWIFENKNAENLNKKVKFSDYFHASVSIATLFNDAFVVTNYSDNGKYISTPDGYNIEKKILRETASPRSLSSGIKTKIIFPYFYKDGKLNRYDENDFLKYFPKASKYLNSNKNKLDERDSDKSSKWFEYGRSQALSHLNQEKLLTSTVVTKNVKIYTLTKECIPYSGIYITSKGIKPLDYAKKILESEDFYSYVQKIGINASGSSLRVTSKDINNYDFLEK